MHISMNHLKGVASILPPMIITISSVSLMSGSQPRLPPGELSNMKPKSAKPQKLTEGVGAPAHGGGRLSRGSGLARRHGGGMGRMAGAGEAEPRHRAQRCLARFQPWHPGPAAWLLLGQESLWPAAPASELN